MGSKPSRSTFLRFLELKNKRKKQGKNENFEEISENFGKYRKILENVEKNRKMSEKIGKIWEIEILVEIFYRSPPKTENSPKFRPKFPKFFSLHESPKNDYSPLRHP